MKSFSKLDKLMATAFFSDANTPEDIKSSKKIRTTREHLLKEVEQINGSSVVYGDGDSIYFTVTEKPRHGKKALERWLFSKQTELVYETTYKPSSKY